MSEPPVVGVAHIGGKAIDEVIGPIGVSMSQVLNTASDLEVEYA